jgi:hypothetical protein
VLEGQGEIPLAEVGLEVLVLARAEAEVEERYEERFADTIVSRLDVFRLLLRVLPEVDPIV